MSIGILMASHGEFAKAALASAEMIAGKQENVFALALTVDKTLEDLEREVETAYTELKKNCDIVVALCDIYGGSPFNAISRCKLKGMEMKAFTGLNLPIVIDLLLSRELGEDEISEHIFSVNAQSVQPIEVTLAEDDDNLEDL